MAYTMGGMKDAYKPYTGGRLAKRAYAKPAQSHTCSSKFTSCTTYMVKEHCMLKSHNQSLLIH